MFDMPIIKLSLDAHNDIKPLLLDLIEKERADKVEEIDKISRTDYMLNDGGIKTETSDYWREFYTQFEDMLDNVYSNHIGYDQWKINSAWFQQYEQSDTHGWHYHETTFYSNVYFLELPEGAPGTQFRLPVSGKLYSPDVREGDMIIFPSIIEHRSPPNFTPDRKSVIAFNVI
jgi:hypothetical protein